MKRDNASLNVLYTNGNRLRYIKRRVKMNFFLKQSAIGLLALFNSYVASAMTCYITLAKDSCWTNYNVTLNVLNASDENDKIVIVKAPKGKTWSREQFECEPSQTLKIEAQFNPVFWEKEQGKKYYGRKYWVLPASLPKEGEVWNISLCYQRDFSGVPLPPNAQGQCICNFKSIPPVKL